MFKQLREEDYKDYSWVCTHCTGEFDAISEQYGVYKDFTPEGDAVCTNCVDLINEEE